MSKTISGILAILMVLLVVAVIFGVCYSQGVFDNLIPSTPGTDEPGTDTPGTDEPGTIDPGTDTPDKEDPSTEDPGTDEPEEDPEQTIIVAGVESDANYSIDGGIYQLARRSTYVFTLECVSDSGNVQDAVFVVPDGVDEDSNNYYGTIEVGKYEKYREDGELKEQWSGITTKPFFYSSIVKSVLIEGNKLTITTWNNYEEYYGSVLPSYHDEYIMEDKYYSTVEPCYLAIPVYSEFGSGVIKIIVTRQVEA